MRIAILVMVVMMLTLSQAKAAADNDVNPWPEIRKARIATLLPSALNKADVDAWVTLCRENNNDPIADHIGCENAGGLAAFVFFRDDNGFHSLVFSPESEAQALQDLQIHDEVRFIPRKDSVLDAVATFFKFKDFNTIAVNSSVNNAQADGLSFTQRMALENALGESLASRLVSSDEVIYHWLSVKLPKEIDILTEAARLSEKWQREAYKQIIPGKTTDADVARFLKAKMSEAGVGDGWAPDQNPNVNSGPDRGHSHSTDKVIMPGDVIQIDFGIKLYDRWVSDIQRFAYVLRESETELPANIQAYWQAAKEGGYAAFKAMKPGVAGYQVDAVQKQLMQQNGSIPVIWSTGHPVGYVAHDTGPSLGSSHDPDARPSSKRLLEQGMVFAFDGFHSWKRDDGTTKTISVEEMVEITADGARYLIPRQQHMILIPSHKG